MTHHYRYKNFAPILSLSAPIPWSYTATFVLSILCHLGCSEGQRARTDASLDGDLDVDIQIVDSDHEDSADENEVFCDGVDNNRNGRTDEGCLCENGWQIEYRNNEVRFGDVWVNSDGTAWACGSGSSDLGDPGYLFYYDGLVWREFPNTIHEVVTSFWGVSSTDIYAVTHNDWVYHFNGEVWESTQTGTEQNFRGVWASPLGEIFAIGFRSIVSHYSGIEWSVFELDGNRFFGGIWGVSPDEVYLSGNEFLTPDLENYLGFVSVYNGFGWEDIYYEDDVIVEGMFGFLSGEVFVVIEGFDVMTNSDGEWESTGGPGVRVVELWGTSPDDLYAFGSRHLAHYDGQEWNVIEVVEDLYPHSVHGSGSNNVMITAIDGIYHRCGSDW